MARPCAFEELARAGTRSPFAETWEATEPWRILTLALQERTMRTSYRVEIEQEEDGRFLAEVVELPGVMAYGETAERALAHVQALALRVLADRLEHDEGPRGGPLSVTFETASAAA